MFLERQSSSARSRNVRGLMASSTAVSRAGDAVPAHVDTLPTSPSRTGDRVKPPRPLPVAGRAETVVRAETVLQATEAGSGYEVVSGPDTIGQGAGAGSGFVEPPCKSE